MRPLRSCGIVVLAGLCLVACTSSAGPGQPGGTQAELEGATLWLPESTVDDDGPVSRSHSFSPWHVLVSQPDKSQLVYTDKFHVDVDEWTSTGANPFFILEPGFELVLSGKEDDEEETVTILVTDETRKIGGVEARVVTETETRGGKLVEISRNYFAMSMKTNSVYYFGEDVDDYKDGKVVSHDGAWLAGEKGARWGMIMPGTHLLGSRYYQEIAPEVAMDRAETVNLAEKCETPGGKFENCLVTHESSPMEKGSSIKVYARGIGLIADGALRLVRHGKKK